MHSSHFSKKDATSHVIEKRLEGVLSHAESHGTEIPGHFSSFADAIRESGVFFGLIYLMLFFLSLPSSLINSLFLSCAVGWIIWKTGRSAWLGWARLERLHRLIEQEKYEIEHHRTQEREELTAMYRLKGFEGKLLEDVIDVLMADQDRLLKVMLEEELGLTLEAHQHPLKQAFGAFLGALCAGAFSWVVLWLFPPFGMLIASAFLVGGGALVSAIYEQNNVTSAIIWNLSLACVAIGALYFVLNLLIPF